MQVILNSIVVAETTFLVTSTDWLLIKPNSNSPIIGDSLLVQANTDIDSIVVSWGDQVKLNHRVMQQFGVSVRSEGMFQSWKVVETPDNPDFGYSMKIAHNIVKNNQILLEDRVIMDQTK